MIILVKNIKDNTIHEVRKYIKSDDGEESVWCNDWYGHHKLGIDCEVFTIKNNYNDEF